MKKSILLLALFCFITVNIFAQNGNTWVKKYYNVSGSWSIKTENGNSYLLLHSDFKTSKGPDLKLFITKKDATTLNKKDPVQKHGVLLGKLKSIKGGQKYLIPSSISLSDYKSIVVHCEKFAKVWGAASL